ncbi:quinon protein alcohol dehydrogenase-like superfamily [Trichoderma longibrachiatum]
MDVLGLLSNISQVVDLLIKIGVMCSIYCVDVKNAPQDVRRLLKEVDRLTAVIKELESLLKSPKGSSKLESQPLRQTIFDLRRLLAELVAKLDLGAKHARAIWPFKRKDIHEIVAAIERQKANILMNINIEQTSILLDVHQDFVLSKLRVAEAAAFNASVDNEGSYCLPGTRSDIIQQIRHWSTSPDSKSIFWLNGMAGTGKSTISRTVAQSFSNDSILGASFFFKRGEGDRGRTTFLFTTLAAQLVRRMPSLAPKIRQVLEFEPQIHEKPLSDQFQMLILDPLRQYAGSWQSPDLLIVIDALDECGFEGSMRTLINTLSQAQHAKNPRLKFFLTSRPELPIRIGFEDIRGKYDNMLLAVVSTPAIEHDIDLYMRHQLEKIKLDYNKSVTQHRKISDDWPGVAVTQKLVASAIPLFIVAATICRFLNDRRLGGPPHQLNRLLKYRDAKLSGLDMTYLPVLDRLTAGLSLSNKQEVIGRFRYLIGSIITLAKPLSVRSLARILNVSTDVIEDQLDVLHSVLGVPSDLDIPVRLLHLSFRDFLVDPEKQLDLDKYPFWINEMEAHSTLYLQCLRSLSRDHVLKNDICSLRDPGTLRSDITQGTIDAYLPNAVKYACTYWVYHLTMSNRSICDNDETHKFLSIYLLNWLEALGLMGQSAESVHMVDALLHKLEGPKSHAIGSFLQDTRRFILANVTTLDKAPLQIYSSALLFAPENSIVRRQYKSNIPTWIRTMPKMPYHWNPCLATIAYQSASLVKLIAFPASDRLISLPTSGGELKIWDLKSASCIATHNNVLPNSVRISPDGAELLYMTGHEVLHVMEAATRTCIGEYRGHTDTVTCAVFSLDGQQFASGSKDGTLRIWDRWFDKPVAIYEYKPLDQLMRFSPDGSTVLTISDRRFVRLLNSRLTRCELNIDSSQAIVHGVDFSPDGQKLLIQYDDTIKCLDLLSGDPLTIRGVTPTFNGRVNVFSDGIRVVSPMRGDAANGYALGIWNIFTATCDALLEGHRATVSDIIISVDESKIASASYDKTIRVWDTCKMSCIATYDGHAQGVFGLVYSSDQTMIISVDVSGTIGIWDTNVEMQESDMERHEGAVLEVMFSADKRRIITTSGDQTVRLWDAESERCLATGTDHQIFAWVPMMIPQDIPTAPYDHVIEHTDGLYGWPKSVKTSPDGLLLLSSAFVWDTAVLKLWNIATGECQSLSQADTDPVVSLAFCPVGNTFTSTTRSGTLRCWDTATLRLLGSFCSDTYAISQTSYLPDGTGLILGCDNGVVRLFHLPTGRFTEMSEQHPDRVRLVATSSNGSMAASYSKSIIKIWGMDTLTCIATCKDPPNSESSISQLLFSPDGQYLVLLYESGKIKVRILRVATGNCIAEVLGICGLANHIELDSTGSKLMTNVGTFPFEPLGSEPNDVEAKPSLCTQMIAKSLGVGLSDDGEWVTWNGCRMLWLPPTHQISASDIDGATSRIALGSRLGRLLLLGVDPSQLPVVNRTPADAKGGPSPSAHQ